MSILTNLMKQEVIWKEAEHWFYCENGFYPDIKNANDYNDVKEIYLKMYARMIKLEDLES